MSIKKNYKNYLKEIKKLNISIRSIYGRNRIALHEPTLNNKEVLMLKKCINSGYVSSAGKYVFEFENHIKKITKSKYAIAIINGTSAIHLALKILGVDKNDEVLIPALNFIASSNSVIYCGAIPHFVDVSESNFGLDPVKLEKYLNSITKIKKGICYNKKTKRIIKAIVPTHLFGHPCQINKILQVAKKFKLAVVEDAAEAIGSYYKKKHLGTFANMGVLSFNGNKTITTGGGGIILTQNKFLADKARHLSTTAKIKNIFSPQHSEIGYNYRLPNINAALGCAQILKLKKILQKKRNLYKKYENKLKSLKFIKLIKEPIDAKSNYWLQVIKIEKNEKFLKNKIITYNKDNGVEVRPVWKTINNNIMYKKCPTMKTKIANSLEKKLICLPSGVKI